MNIKQIKQLVGDYNKKKKKNCNYAEVLNKTSQTQIIREGCWGPKPLKHFMMSDGCSEMTSKQESIHFGA